MPDTFTFVRFTGVCLIFIGFVCLTIKRPPESKPPLYNIAGSEVLPDGWTRFWMETNLTAEEVLKTLERTQPERTAGNLQINVSRVEP